MEQWEYLAERFFYDERLDERLNELGTSGWELVGFAAIIIKETDEQVFQAVFKRPREETVRRHSRKW